MTTNQVVALKRTHLFVVVRAAPCDVPERYASVAVLPRLDLRPFERPGRAEATVVQHTEQRVREKSTQSWYGGCCCVVKWSKRVLQIYWGESSLSGD